MKYLYSNYFRQNYFLLQGEMVTEIIYKDDFCQFLWKNFIGK